jgi:hypothetical protein
MPDHNKDPDITYAVINSAFHNGGILATTSSPREAHRLLEQHSDQCRSGSGCQSLAWRREDGPWKRCDIQKETPSAGYTSARHGRNPKTNTTTHDYADGTYYVHRTDQEVPRLSDHPGPQSPALCQ